MSTLHSFLAPVRGRCFSVLGGLCVLVGGLLLAPRAAEASCGDYLAHPQHPLMHGETAQLFSRQSEDAPVAPRPCHGPSCRRNDAPIPVPTPAPVRLLGERWATVVEFELVLPTAATFFPESTEDLLPSTLPARLDRPPKMG